MYPLQRRKDSGSKITTFRESIVAKSPPNHDAVALNALSKLLGDPTPKVLHGTKAVPGVFSGAKAEKEAARIACERKWLEKTGGTVGKGKKAKELFRLTPEGAQAVFAGSEAVQLLRVMQAELTRSAQALTDMSSRLDFLKGGMHSLQQVIGQVAEKVQPPNLETLRQAMTPAPAAPQPSGNGTPDEVTAQEIEQSLQAWVDRGEAGDCPFPELYQQLRRRHPALGIGHFHDILRRLHRDGKIRFGNWGRPLDDIPEPDLALFISHKVMYYARLA